MTTKKKKPADDALTPPEGAVPPVTPPVADTPPAPPTESPAAPTEPTKPEVPVFDLGGPPAPQGETQDGAQDGGGQQEDGKPAGDQPEDDQPQDGAAQQEEGKAQDDQPQGASRPASLGGQPTETDDADVEVVALRDTWYGYKGGHRTAKLKAGLRYHVTAAQAAELTEAGVAEPAELTEAGVAEPAEQSE